MFAGHYASHYKGQYISNFACIMHVNMQVILPVIMQTYTWRWVKCPSQTKYENEEYREKS